MTEEALGTPWYQHFWPWFIVILMVVSVAASLGTVAIAFGLGDLELPADRPVSVGSRTDDGPARP